ncbi:hypothetical protein [uncultured Treponema sp.]|uniref:hypothetical protein n=1 Tax=uncultured Treponema sp. TaxID=162155 RepID=UPI0025E0B016|nr:hypothetical protein [uncultured Treponema sp.]
MKLQKSIIALVATSILFNGCLGKNKNEKTSPENNEQVTVLDQQREEYEKQQKDTKGSDAAKYGKTAAGATGGVVIGGAAGVGAGVLTGVIAGITTGAVTGAAAGTVVPVFGNITGAIVGAAAGGVLAIAGGITGGKLVYSLANGELSEYINVETRFVFTRHNSDEIKTNIYGAAQNSDASKYFLPRFPVNEEVQLIIEMNASMLEEYIKKASRKQKSADLLIPVEIVVSKSKNIEVQYDGGLQKERITIENDISGEGRFSFFIKNNKDLHPTIKFLFTPAETGDAEICVTYGTPEYKIVESTCDIVQTMKFIEE